MPIKWQIHATVSIFHGDIYLQKLAVNSIKVTVAKGNNAQSETLCPFISLHEMASVSSNYDMYFYTGRPAETFKKQIHLVVEFHVDKCNHHWG